MLLCNRARALAKARRARRHNPAEANVCDLLFSVSGRGHAAFGVD